MLGSWLEEGLLDLGANHSEFALPLNNSWGVKGVSIKTDHCPSPSNTAKDGPQDLKATSFFFQKKKLHRDKDFLVDGLQHVYKSLIAFLLHPNK